MAGLVTSMDHVVTNEIFLFFEPLRAGRLREQIFEERLPRFVDVARFEFQWWPNSRSCKAAASICRIHNLQNRRHLSHVILSSQYLGRLRLCYREYLCFRLVLPKYDRQSKWLHRNAANVGRLIHCKTGGRGARGFDCFKK
jgi:hypothetical protein